MMVVTLQKYASDDVAQRQVAKPCTGVILHVGELIHFLGDRPWLFNEIPVILVSYYLLVPFKRFTV